MTQNSAPQVFEGGWEKTASAIHTGNQITLATNPRAYFIRPDGTELFTVEGSIISTRPLSVPWDVDSAGAVTSTFNCNNEDTTPESIFFKDDGSKLFMLGSVTNDLFQYDVPTPWNVGTASLEDGNSLTGISDPTKIFFSRDGDFLYVVDPVVGIVYRFEVPSFWDINFLQNLTSFNPGLVSLTSVSVKPEGDKMFLSDFTPKQIIEYTLSPNYSLSSPTVGDSVTITQNPIDIFFRGTGSQVFVEQTSTKTITRFELEIEWDIPTASFFENNLLVNQQPRAMFWKPDGLKMFEVDSDQDEIRAYTATTPFNTSTLTLLPDVLDVSNEDALPFGMFWSNDGTFLFMLGIEHDSIYKYVTTVPYSIEPGDINSTPIQTFELPLNAPTGIWFSPDGNIMLVSASDAQTRIFQYNLSGSYVLPSPDLDPPDKTFFIPVPDQVNPRDIFLKNDGLQMYLPSLTNDTMARYTITTPLIPNVDFDITTAVLADELDISGVMPFPAGISLSNDGKKIFIVDPDNDKIHTFDTV